MGGSRGGRGPGPPPFVPRCRLLTLGPKLDPRLPPFFACRPNLDPPPFQKSWIRPCHLSITIRPFIPPSIHPVLAPNYCPACAPHLNIGYSNSQSCHSSQCQGLSVGGRGSLDWEGFHTHWCQGDGDREDGRGVPGGAKGALATHPLHPNLHRQA